MASTPMVARVAVLTWLKNRPGSTVREAAFIITGEGDTRTPQRAATYGVMVGLERQGLIHRQRDPAGDRWFLSSHYHKQLPQSCHQHVDDDCTECGGSGVSDESSVVEIADGWAIQTMVCQCVQRGIDAVNKASEADQGTP